LIYLHKKIHDYQHELKMKFPQKVFWKKSNIPSIISKTTEPFLDFNHVPIIQTTRIPPLYITTHQEMATTLKQSRPQRDLSRQTKTKQIPCIPHRSQSLLSAGKSDELYHLFLPLQLPRLEAFLGHSNWDLLQAGTQALPRPVGKLP